MSLKQRSENYFLENDPGGQRVDEATEHALKRELSGLRRLPEPSPLPKLTGEYLDVLHTGFPNEPGEGPTLLLEDNIDPRYEERLEGLESLELLIECSLSVRFIIESQIFEENILEIWHTLTDERTLSDSLKKLKEQKQTGYPASTTFSLRTIYNQTSGEAYKNFMESLPKTEKDKETALKIAAIHENANQLREAGAQEITLTGEDMAAIEKLWEINLRCLTEHYTELADKYFLSANEDEIDEARNQCRIEAAICEQKLRTQLRILNTREQTELGDITKLTDQELTRRRLELYREWGVDDSFIDIKALERTAFYLHADTPMPILTNTFDSPLGEDNLTTVDILANRRDQEVLGFNSDELDANRIDLQIRISPEGIPSIPLLHERIDWYNYGEENPQQTANLKNKLQ